jgi:hypothetical protein
MRRQSMVSRQDDDKRPNSPTVDESISCGRVFYSSMVRSWPEAAAQLAPNQRQFPVSLRICFRPEADV